MPPQRASFPSTSNRTPPIGHIEANGTHKVAREEWFEPRCSIPSAIASESGKETPSEGMTEASTAWDILVELDEPVLRLVCGRQFAVLGQLALAMPPQAASADCVAICSQPRCVHLRTPKNREGAGQRAVAQDLLTHQVY